MVFDVVIGNPPYNNGMDIDFIFMGQERCRKCCVTITPAKWHTAEYNQAISSSHTYGEFRNRVEPYVSEIVFYPDCKDVFEIQQCDGITYYCINKNKVDACKVTNKCSVLPIYNNTMLRNIKDAPLNNLGNKVVEYLKANKFLAFDVNQVKQTGRYRVYFNDQLPGGGPYAMTKSDPKTYYLGVIRIYDSTEPEWNSALNSIERQIFASDSLDECKYFKSWISSKIVRYCISINISKLSNIYNNHYLRYVPAPPMNQNGDYIWNHLYTDLELYNYYRLNDEYKNIIEAVVKDRK